MKNVKKLLFFLLLLNFKSFGQFTLQITAAGAGSGQISVNGVTQNSTYSAQFTSNETVNLSAIANTGSHFFDWSGDLVSTNSNESILMDSDKSITITFELNQYQINLSQEPPVGGTVTGGGNYLYGDEAVVSATSNSSYDFVNWTENGTQVSTSATFNFTVNSSKNLVANFALKNYNISGNTGIGSATLTWLDGTTKTATSAVNGSYTITVPFGWSGTITPSKTGYTFNPSQKSYVTVISNQSNQNYSAELNTFTISGNTGIGSTTLTWVDGTTKTTTSGIDGSYSISVPYDWSGTVTPSKPGYTFTPIQKSYSNIVSNQSNQNYSAELNTISISGSTGIGSATLTWVDGTTKTSTSGSDGSYSISVPYGWSGTVTPTKTGYTFTPTQKSYSNIIASQVNQNYTAAINNFTISGNAGTASVTLTWVDGTTKTSTSGSDGSYSISVPYSWSGTVTPTKTGYTFTPAQKSYSNIIASQVNQNYTAAINNFTISGNAGTASATLTWLDETEKTTTSAANGSYSISVPYGWSGTVTPTKTGYTFTPAQKSYSNIITSQVNQNYSATINTFTISGNAGTASATLTWLDETEKTTTSAANGSYSISVPYGWSGTVTPTKIGYTFTPESKNYNNIISNFANQNFTAALNKYGISFISGGTGTGKIKVNGITHSLPYSEDFNYNSVVIIEGVPAKGSNYTSWSGDLTGNTNPTTVTVLTAKNITVNFTLKQYQIELSRAPIQGGTASGGGNYYFGQEATVIATPSRGYSFTNWTENNIQVSQDSLYKFTVDTSRTLTANFSRRVRSVTTIVNPELSGVVTGAGNYNEGDLVKMVAFPSNGWRFVNWTENNIVLSSDSIYTFNILVNRTITGNFTKKIYSVVLSINPEESGNLNGAGTYNHGDIVTVSTTSNEGWVFKNWTENNQIISENSSYSFAISNPRNFTANYEKKKYTISTSSSPAAGGTTEGGATYSHGDNVVLTANAESDNGYDFVNWTENGTEVSTSSTYSFTATKNRSLVANFKLRTYAISLSIYPENSGTVTGGNTYTHGQSITVQAIPKSGWLFVNWTENNVNVSNSASYSFTAVENRTLIANFSKDIYSIAAISSPLEAGSISGTGSFYYGQTATLIAEANPGWKFVNWTKNGTIVSSDTAYIFNVKGSESFVANFKLADYLINCSSLPIEGGFTSGCGIARYNQIMTLKAEANDGYRFINWTENGVIVSSDAQYEFTVKKSINVIANFDFISSIEKEDFESIPDHYFMSNAYPNPFNPETKIKFGLPEQSIVNLFIVDITGRIVDNAIDGVILPAGNFTNNFSGKNLASGIYFFILNSKSTISEKHFRKTGKLILLK